ncbi:tetratricopeptide repeat protein [Candidatus Woesearchaeota archaeon]|nr:tetratricopeptide repeat protein [Candidatus Woesearchaeota archaeon]
MQTQELINLIMWDNSECKIRSDAKDFDGAFLIHGVAVFLSRRGVAEGINPDYLAFSLANRAYSERQLGRYDVSLDTLEEALLCVEKSTTSFGRGRVLEEMALVHRYRGVDKEKDLEIALPLAEKAIEAYEKGLSARADGEIVDRKEIYDRFCRVTGIAGMIYAELGRLKSGEEKQVLLKKGAEYAFKEVWLRKIGGIDKGEAYSNACHSAGAALTESVGQDTVDEYHKAKDCLLEAGVDASEATKAVLKLRLAWLEYKHADPSHESEMRNLFDTFMSDPIVGTKGFKGVRDALRVQVETLSKQFGEPYLSQAEKFYSS